MVRVVFVRRQTANIVPNLIHFIQDEHSLYCHQRRTKRVWRPPELFIHVELDGSPHLYVAQSSPVVVLTSTSEMRQGTQSSCSRSSEARRETWRPWRGNAWRKQARLTWRHKNRTTDFNNLPRFSDMLYTDADGFCHRMTAAWCLN